MWIPNCSETTKTIIIKSIYLEMILKFNTKENFEQWLNGQTLPSGYVIITDDLSFAAFTTNNIDNITTTFEFKNIKDNNK